MADASSGTTHRWSSRCATPSRVAVPRRSLSVALVVGSILNLINQGDRLIDGQSLDFIKLALTYCVPYFFSTYGAVAFRLCCSAQRRACASRTEEELVDTA